MKEIVRQTKQLAHVQRDFMLEQLRRAQLDVNNSNYEDSRAKIGAVRSVIYKGRDSLGLENDDDDSFDKGLMIPSDRRPITDN